MLPNLTNRKAWELLIRRLAQAFGAGMSSANVPRAYKWAARRVGWIASLTVPGPASMLDLASHRSPNPPRRDWKQTGNLGKVDKVGGLWPMRLIALGSLGGAYFSCRKAV